MLMTEPFTAVFYALYILCAISDVADGYIARRTHTESKTGEVLDSAADLIFTAVVLIKIIPVLSWEKYIIVWCIAIATVKVTSVAAGYIKFKRAAFLHTYLNKLAGVTVFSVPLLASAVDFGVIAVIGCTVATLAAAEELVIIIGSKQLERNAKGLFIK